MMTELHEHLDAGDGDGGSRPSSDPARPAPISIKEEGSVTMRSKSDDERKSLTVEEVFQQDHKSDGGQKQKKKQKAEILPPFDGGGGGGDNQQQHMLSLLWKKINELEDRVQELQYENKQLTENYDFLNGSAMVNDMMTMMTMNDGSDKSIDTTKSAESRQSVIHLLAAEVQQLRQSTMVLNNKSGPPPPALVELTDAQKSQKRWSKLQECYNESFCEHQQQQQQQVLPPGSSSTTTPPPPRSPRDKPGAVTGVVTCCCFSSSTPPPSPPPPSATSRDTPNAATASAGSATGVNSNGSGFSRNRDLVFLHPEEVGKRDYTAQELNKIQYRPYPSRIFITNIQLEWNTVWLRTRHTDHHVHSSSFIQIRDAFKADAITNNPPGAKYALTELLNMCYGMNESDYYSFACTIASAFSQGGINTEFEKSLLMHPARMEIITRRLEEMQIMAGGRSFHNLRGSPLLNNNTNNNNYSNKAMEWELLIKEHERGRKRLIQLMDIVFSKLKQKKLLVDDNRDNIYRLVLCMTKYTKSHQRKTSWLLPYFYALFSFFFQVCAASYVALSLTDLDHDEINIQQWDGAIVRQNIALAVGTLAYGTMVAFPEILSTRKVYTSLYRSELGLLSAMDFFINCFLPLSVAICGFLVVLQAESFLEGVLNAVALIFITEIDDQLPHLLELDKKDIVQGFLIDQAMEEYRDQDLDREIPEIEFNDLHITNTPESGSNPSRGITLQPYEVIGDDNYDDYDDLGGGSTALSARSIGIDMSEHTITHRVSMQSSSTYATVQCISPMTKRGGVQVKRLREGDMGQQVANKRSVTQDCLLRKIEWQYTGDPKGRFAATSSPRIGHLRLHKLVGDGPPINIEGKQKAPPSANKPWFSITGVYIITSFSMSDDVLRLRVCGSQTAKDFKNAFDYYSLWPLEHSAKHLLNNTTIEMTQEERDNNWRVLHGMERAMSPKTRVSFTEEDGIIKEEETTPEEAEIQVNNIDESTSSAPAVVPALPEESYHPPSSRSFH